jgi:long-chain fatty acid transport protein
MSVRSPRSVAAAVVFCSAVAPSPVLAAGFALFEQGARGMGFAGAFTAQASDPSAIFHNAAGIAFLKGSRIYLGGTAVAPKSTFTGADPFPGAGITEKGDAGILFPPAVYYSQPFTERLAFGVGVNVPFGLRSRWANPDTFSGRFVSQLAELKGFSLNPTVAYKLADRLAVGAGLDVRFSTVTLDRRVPLVNPFTQKVVDVATVRLDSDTATGFGFNVGILAKPSESLSIGAAYRHKVKVDYDGHALFEPVPTGNAQLDALVGIQLPQGSQTVATSITFPALASGGVAYGFGDWIVEADVDWYQWSTFRTLRIDFVERPDLSQVLPENYENSWQLRAGLERTINDRWAVRGGYFFDQTPAPAASVSPLLPDASRHGISLGGSWVSGRLRLDGATWYVFSKERSTEGVNRDEFNGTYKNQALTFGLSLGYSF